MSFPVCCSLAYTSEYLENIYHVVYARQIIIGRLEVHRRRLARHIQVDILPVQEIILATSLFGRHVAIFFA